MVHTCPTCSTFFKVSPTIHANPLASLGPSLIDNKLVFARLPDFFYTSLHVLTNYCSTSHNTHYPFFTSYHCTKLLYFLTVFYTFFVTSWTSINLCFTSLPLYITSTLFSCCFPICYLAFHYRGTIFPSLTLHCTVRLQWPRNIAISYSCMLWWPHIFCTNHAHRTTIVPPWTSIIALIGNPFLPWFLLTPPWRDTLWFWWKPMCMLYPELTPLVCLVANIRLGYFTIHMWLFNMLILKGLHYYTIRTCTAHPHATHMFSHMGSKFHHKLTPLW